jgi:imidazolonepropionase-like amidohydrolase
MRFDTLWRNATRATRADAAGPGIIAGRDGRIAYVGPEAGLLGETGMLELGKVCDLAIWNAGMPAELVCRIGFNPLHRRVRRGQ